MDALVRRLYEEAIPFGPCEYFTGDESLMELMRKFLTAKGAEFCIKNDFPSDTLCDALKREDLAGIGIYIDAGKQSLRNPMRIALVGACEFNLFYDTAAYPCRVILMKGARAHIKAGGYSVVAIQAQDGCRYDIQTSDNAIVR